jgi:hypothetical protein
MAIAAALDKFAVALLPTTTVVLMAGNARSATVTPRWRHAARRVPTVVEMVSDEYALGHE